MPENIVDAKLNPGEPSSSSSVTKDEVKVITPADEKSVTTENSSNDVPFHEHPRWKEVMEEKNNMKMQAEMLAREVETLKRQNAGNNEASKQKSMFDEYVDKYVNKGMDRASATDFVQDLFGVAQTVSQQSVAPLYQTQGQLTLSQSLSSFEKDNPDYKKYSTKMSEILATMPKQDQDWIMMNLPRGLKQLYNEAKEADREVIEKEQVEKGRREAYEKKQEKASVSQSRSSSLGTITESLVEELKSLSNEQYSKRKAEFDEYEAKMKGLR